MTTSSPAGQVSGPGPDGGSPPLPFKNGPRVLRGWIALMVAIPVGCLTADALTPSGPTAPNAWWWFAGTYLTLVVFSGLLFIPQSWGSVEVDDEGLHVRGRLVVPVHRLGEVRLLSGHVAMLTSWFPHGRTVG